MSSSCSVVEPGICFTRETTGKKKGKKKKVRRKRSTRSFLGRPAIPMVVMDDVTWPLSPVDVDRLRSLLGRVVTMDFKMFTFHRYEVCRSRSNDHFGRWERGI